MKRSLLGESLFVLLLLAPFALAEGLAVRSPDGKVATSVGLDETGHHVIAASFDGKTVLEESPVGVIIGGRDIGAGALIGESVQGVSPVFRALVNQRGV